MSVARTARAQLAVATLVAAALVGCSGQAPDARPTAQALAAGLAKGDLASVALNGATPAEATTQLAEITRGMSGRRPAVALQDVQTAKDSKTATATLRLTWDLSPGPEDWTYTTTAPLVRADKGWSVVWAPKIVHQDLAAGERFSMRSTAAVRGDIVGSGGTVLVTNRPVFRVGIDKTAVSGAAAVAAAKRLARLVGVDPAAYAKEVAGAGAKAFVEAIVLRREAAAPLVDRIDAVPGAERLPSTLPLAPSRTFARPILGTVGEATAEIVEASKGQIRAGDMAGLSGLQKRYDAQLRGERGLTVSIVAPQADGTDPEEAAVVYSREPRAGTDVVTTLDRTAQQVADDILEPVQPASAIVAIRASTGEVVAAASGPGGGGLSTATVGRFPPGSTFKVVDALALLRKGKTPASPLPCTSTITVEGKSFKNYSDYPSSGIGTIPLRSAFANSCNSAFISQYESVNAPELTQAAAALGLGIDQDLGVAAFLGSVPSDGDDVDHAAALIGQARVEASPLAMATVAASVAAGRTVVPKLVTGGSAQAATPDEPVTAAEAATLRQLMRAVVTDGSGRFLQGVPGGPVGAKTGTAEFGDDTPRRTHGWMIAVRRDLAVAVFVAEAESGSRTAGPLLEAFLRRVPR